MATRPVIGYFHSSACVFAGPRFSLRSQSARCSSWSAARPAERPWPIRKRARPAPSRRPHPESSRSGSSGSRPSPRRFTRRRRGASRERIYVVEQAGRIRVIQKGRVLSKPFLDIRPLVSSGGERGLLSVAFHPDYAQNRLFYVNYTNVDGDTRVVEYRARAGASPARQRELLAVNQPVPEPQRWPARVRKGRLPVRGHG